MRYFDIRCSFIGNIAFLGGLERIHNINILRLISLPIMGNSFFLTPSLRTFNNCIAVFGSNIVMLHEVSEASMQVKEDRQKNQQLIILSFLLIIYYQVIFSSYFQSIPIELEPSMSEGVGYIFQYPNFWSFSEDYAALPYQRTCRLVF